MMRFILRTLLIAALAVPSMATMSQADSQVFNVVNHSSSVIAFVYVSADYETSWGEDRILYAQVVPFEGLEVSINGYGTHCIFDVRMVDENGSSREFRNLDLCNSIQVTFTGQ